MRTTMISSKWSDSEQKWTVEIERTLPDGSKQMRTFHPRHIIQATGHSGKKNFPSIPGMENFKGSRLCHSSEFTGAKPNGKGKKAIVVGCCNSGHDISQTFFENGYDVTMVQRSTTCVVSSESITSIALAGVYSEDGPPVDDADMWLHGTPMSVLKRIQLTVTKLSQEKDRAILDGLAKAGFALDKGPDDAGLFMKYYQRGGGYYIDVGASQLIIDGKIKIKQGQELAEVLPNGLKFADGSELEADEIIFATGYQNMRSEARTIFGDELADRIKNVWGFDEEGEFRTMWRDSGHPGFWYMVSFPSCPGTFLPYSCIVAEFFVLTMSKGGNLALCRYYSLILALQIKAREVGLNPA
jgi:cation diffusion facilitator CzcD-associated flavoprotein CzcO